jgi:Arm DNA-binding domain
MAVQFTGRFTKTFLDNPADGTHTDGTGLYLAVRNGGKARSWSFRHRGKRKTIGSALRIPLEQAQERLQQFKAKLKAGEDPMATISNAWTFADEADLFYAHKCKEDWGNDAQKLGKSMINKYIKSTAFGKVPLVDIGVGEMCNILKATWSGKNATPVMAKRSAYMIQEMIGLAQNADPPRYPLDKKNPVDLTKRGRLRKLLGKQPWGGHRLGLQPELVPKLVAHLREPLYAHGPNECTTAEAAEAIGCIPQAIFHAWRRGKLKYRRKLESPYNHMNATWVWSIAELKKVFRFRKEPRQRAEIGPHAYVLLFIIFTAVRSDMACGLLWEEVKENRGMIDFGKRHKMAERDPEADYTIPITPEVKALLKTMKEKQLRDGLEDTPYVFVHGWTRIGTGHYYGNPVNPNTVNTFLKRALVRLGLVNGETDPKKMPSVHGFRSTFPEWASDLNEVEQYKQEYIEAQLGHKLKVDNRMYFRNVTYLRHRLAMMTAWEQYCAPAADNVIKLDHKRLA